MLALIINCIIALAIGLLTSLLNTNEKGLHPLQPAIWGSLIGSFLGTFVDISIQQAQMGLSDIYANGSMLPLYAILAIPFSFTLATLIATSVLGIRNHYISKKKSQKNT